MLKNISMIETLIRLNHMRIERDVEKFGAEQTSSMDSTWPIHNMDNRGLIIRVTRLADNIKLSQLFSPKTKIVRNRQANTARAKHGKDSHLFHIVLDRLGRKHDLVHSFALHESAQSIAKFYAHSNALHEPVHCRSNGDFI